MTGKKIVDISVYSRVGGGVFFSARAEDDAMVRTACHADPETAAKNALAKIT